MGNKKKGAFSFSSYWAWFHSAYLIYQQKSWWSTLGKLGGSGCLVTAGSEQFHKNYKPELSLCSCRQKCEGAYRVLFLTVPPDFQCPNEKKVAANQDYFFKKISMQKSSSLAEQVFFSFWYWKLGGTVKKITLYVKGGITGLWENLIGQLWC